jgi:hypothetical protein
VNVIGTFDESGLRESEYGISAAGTFRVEGETDESKQPMFNLARVDCENQSDDTGKVSLECKVTMAVVYAESGKPDPDNPNCSLDLDSSTYSMKELQKGILTGIETSTRCRNGRCSERAVDVAVPRDRRRFVHCWLHASSCSGGLSMWN